MSVSLTFDEAEAFFGGHSQKSENSHARMDKLNDDNMILMYPAGGRKM